ncbi:SCO family protein [Niabella ginsengisoli]|uniref:SCO family protein n=1 Tax=Niabella ginsengisoli TaxID=522298 RepID=A0ABS9SIN1_9BACT|nr:SCO family protein [Niabella ginsengisoli]MCH5598196.1 SCO family protein [Niabella ginsengisoli]
MLKIVSLFVIAICLVSCSSQPQILPILGAPAVNGSDTVYPAIPDFRFIDQDSNIVTQSSFKNKIYITDFIFLSCPTICPRMTKEMKTVYTTFASDDRVKLLSHTIDPDRDSIERLKAYANSLNASSSKWHFVTGNQDSIIYLAEKAYYSTAYPDSTSPGGFAHSAALLLIDKNKHIRGVYNSTEPKETERLINDIQILLKEQF